MEGFSRTSEKNRDGGNDPGAGRASLYVYALYHRGPRETREEVTEKSVVGEGAFSVPLLRDLGADRKKRWARLS